MRPTEPAPEPVVVAAKPFRLPWYKRVLRHPVFQQGACWLMASLLKLCWRTYRMKQTIASEAKPFMCGEQAGIFCFWHGRMIIFPSLKPKHRAMRVLISHHRDGELITRIIRHFGVDSVRGSSNRGAMEATRELARCLKQGDNVAITPDGPRGPARIAQEGAVMLARLSATPLIPVSFSASRAWQFNSWDRFMIPKPFARVAVLVGAPMVVERSSDLAAASQMLAHVMNQLTDEADQMMDALVSDEVAA